MMRTLATMARSASVPLLVHFLAPALVLLPLNGCGTTTRTSTTYSTVLTGPPVATRVGIGEDYPTTSWSMKIVRHDLDVMQRANLKLLRVALAWDHIEPRPGEYEWGFWDQFVRESQARGIELLPYVCYTPAWDSAAASDCWKQPPREVKAFAQFISAAATRYRGKVHSWELWNEPDNADYWTGTVKQYAQLVRAGSDAVRAADPSAKVVLGGISWNVSFLMKLFRDEHIGEVVDFVNLHNYDETWIPDPLERLPDYVERVHDLIARYGGKQSIWMAEIGYSDYRHGDDVSADYVARFNYEHTAAYQADDLFRAMTLLLSTGDISLATWYRINDLPATQDVIGDVNNRHLGIVTAGGEAKPAMSALRDFVELFGGTIEELDARCRVVKSSASHAEVHCFRRSDGDVIAVVWLPTDIAGLPRRPGKSDGSDDRSESIELSVPATFANVSERCLNDSNRHSLSVETTGGDSLVKIINLRGGETRIVRFSQKRP